MELGQGTGPLRGIRVVELAGIGPGPHACMILADLGADVIRVDRPGGQLLTGGSHDLLNRGRPSVALDLKHPDAVATVLDLVEGADVLVEGLRPGTTERLGLGPDDCRARNPRLVYARMTGWGQDGPLARTAGHDLGYVALTGALYGLGQDPARPHFPGNLVGDFGGGSTYLVIGVLAALLESRLSGQGQVVDAAIVDGTAHLNSMATGLLAGGLLKEVRAANLLDGGTPYYDLYETADGRHLAIAALEPQFYDELVARLDIAAVAPDRDDPDRRRELRGLIADTVRGRTQAEWVEVFDGSDACVAPVLRMSEAFDHPHLVARETFVERNGATQPAPAPRFSRTSPTLTTPPPARAGEHTREALTAWGVTGVDGLLAGGSGGPGMTQAGTERVDVLIIGAGLSGIGAAAQLTRELPHTSYVVLEARAVSGGTWDLFRYPGVRSDSDMYTMGYAFRPWRHEEALGSGERILEYLRETAREYDVERHIRYSHRVVRATWDSAESAWTVEAERDGEAVSFTAGLLWSCRGYYDHEHGYEPEFAGTHDFAGPIVHPQHWPADLDWTGRDVVVIGSGATAVTLVPAMAADAAHVTMLQRSPSYVLSLPQRDPLAARARRWLPAPLAHRVVRWKSIVVQAAFYRLSRSRPALMKRVIRKQNVASLPAGYDVATHFAPRYEPWDQRMCFVPDGDFFAAVRRGAAEVVTSTIERFDADGIRLTSGRHLHADVIVTATGLTLSPFGGIELVVDGEKVDPSSTMTYRALMLSEVPNFVFTVGYTNASWTLKVDLVAAFTCRLLAFMAERGYRRVVPRSDPDVGQVPLMDFTSGYVLRALDQLPHQGDREPWRLRQSYLRDRRTIRRAPLEDGVLDFS